ncbi:hypothetical protein Taro_027173 [Colocasia esculenta]|uniref:DUF4219 domain-containing protein n=1 Tax=Colocasia esculenta TaxID=4460 RepID=A0A843VJC9_COLES|nr:hypothetical protein [Colocasia esculenta]
MANGMATLNLFQSLVPIFSGENYEFWSIKLRTFFISQDLWDLVEVGYAEEESSKEKAADHKELRKKDAKALMVLQLDVSDIAFPRIANAIRSKEAWTISKQEFHGDGKICKGIIQGKWKDGNWPCNQLYSSSTSWGKSTDILKDENKKLGHSVKDLEERIAKCNWILRDKLILSGVLVDGYGWFIYGVL